MSKHILKSIWAVFAGFLTVFVLSVLTDVALESLGIFPSPDQGLFVPWMLALALVYRNIYAVLGGYVTAVLAPHKPMRHVMILAGIGLLGAIAGIAVNSTQNLGPAWYPIALAAFTVPCVWLGGKLRIRKN